MAVMFKKVRAFVSIRYYHGGEGLEKTGMHFYPTIEAYNEKAREEGWSDDSPSHKSYWHCTPKEVDVLIRANQVWKLKEGTLPAKHVAFPAESLSALSTIGWNM